MALGFRQAGFDIVGFLEIEPTARATFTRNFAHAVELGEDVRLVTSEHAAYWREALGPIDVLCGGPPCQGFSLAGKRDRHDRRNTLFRDYLRLASAIRPRIILMENVRLLTSMRAPDGRLVTAHILEEFASIGYRAAFRTLNAQDYGVPQFRERVIFVAVDERQVPIDSLFPKPTHGGCLSAPLFASLLTKHLTFRDAAGDLKPLEAGQASPSDPYHWAVAHPEHVIRWLKPVPEGMSAHENADPTLRPPSGYNTTYKRLRWDEPSSTIGTTFGMISACRTVHPVQTRSLTVREAMRCQTFPDDFVLEGSWGDIRRQIGNAVPPRLAFVFAQTFLQMLARTSVIPGNRRQAAC